MRNLRNQLIRLAHRKPHLRAHILPLLSNPRTKSANSSMFEHWMGFRWEDFESRAVQLVGDEAKRLINQMTYHGPYIDDAFDMYTESAGELVVLLNQLERTTKEYYDDADKQLRIIYKSSEAAVKEAESAERTPIDDESDFYDEGYLDQEEIEHLSTIADQAISYINELNGDLEIDTDLAEDIINFISENGDDDWSAILSKTVAEISELRDLALDCSDKVDRLNVEIAEATQLLSRELKAVYNECIAEFDSQDPNRKTFEGEFGKAIQKSERAVPKSSGQIDSRIKQIG